MEKTGIAPRENVLWPGVDSHSILGPGWMT